MGAGVAGKKIGPNERCSCGSGKKSKKCCFGGRSVTAVTAPGQLLPGSAEELGAAARAAAQAQENTKAAHFYTMAIDKLAKTLTKDEAGFVSAEALASMKGAERLELAKLLAGRSAVHLRQDDIAAAEEDAATSIRAGALEEGHLALLAVFEKAGAPLRGQLQVVEGGLEECPTCEALVRAKWRLKKALSLEPTTNSIEEETVDPAAKSADMLGRVLAEPGPSQDLHRAVQLLQVAASAGNVDARRRLGMVMLELDRPVEAAEEFAKAAEAGDQEAAEILQRLRMEAVDQSAKARAKLEALAAAGDLRAQAMLEELS